MKLQSGSSGVLRAEGQSFASHVDETVSALLQQVTDQGMDASAIRLIPTSRTCRTTTFAIVVERMAAAGFTTNLIDDRIPPRPGTVRSGSLAAHELAVMDQASAARAEAEHRRAR
jgi:hypothetical protein